MKWLNGCRIRLVLFGFVAAIVLGGGGRANADFTFGTPKNLGPVVNSSSFDNLCCMTADALEMYIASNRPGGYGSFDLYVATRESTDHDWGPPVNLGPTVNTPGFEGHGCISADGLELYFLSENRPGGFGNYDLWVTTRATKADKWGIPVNIGPTVNSSSQVPHGATISSDGLSLYFASNRAGGSGSWDLWVTTRATLSDPWGPPVNLGSTVNGSNADLYPSISSDGLLLFFDYGPASASGPDDIWVTRRATVSDSWGPPVNVGPPVNTSADDGASNVSADGRTLYFTRTGYYGTWDIWEAPIIPVVDFNGDGIVDLKDFSKLAQYWGQRTEDRGQRTDF